MTSLTVLSVFPVVASLPPKRRKLETRAEKNRMLSQATLCRSSWGTLSKRIAALFLRRNFILVSCSLETNFVPPWKSQVMFIVWSEWRVRVWSGAKTTRLRLGRSILSLQWTLSSPLIFLFPIIPCASVTVTACHSRFALASVRKTKHLRRRQTLEWNSFRNESQSGIILTAPQRVNKKGERRHAELPVDQRGFLQSSQCLWPVIYGINDIGWGK